MNDDAGEPDEDTMNDDKIRTLMALADAYALTGFSAVSLTLAKAMPQRAALESALRALVAPGEPAEPFGYIVTNNVPESSPYRHLFYRPSEINSAYHDNALYSTPVYAHAALVQAVPLTDARVWEIVDATPPIRDASCEWLIFARAVERAHGIGAEVKP